MQHVHSETVELLPKLKALRVSVIPKRHQSSVLELKIIFEQEGEAQPIASVQLISEDDFTSNLEQMTRVALGHAAISIRKQRADLEREKSDG